MVLEMNEITLKWKVNKFCVHYEMNTKLKVNKLYGNFQKAFKTLFLGTCNVDL